MNPQGTIPTIKDNGFILWESNAILTYLAQKHGWTDLYPTEVSQRSIIDQYLHWHHRNAREASVRLVAPNLRKDLKFPEGWENQGRITIANSLQVLETGPGMLAQTKYIGSNTVTLADFSCFMEFGQLNSRFGNLFDFSPYPKVQAWMDRMADIPYFKEVNMANHIIGDLSEGVEKDVIRRANKESTVAIRSAISKGRL